MNNLTLNNWDALHPLTIHFPIVLLLIAPLFIIVGTIFLKSSKSFYATALILLWLGTFGLFIAISTGEAASEHLTLTEETMETLEHHEELAEQCRLIFSALTIFFTLFVLWKHFLKKSPPQSAPIIVLFLFLGAYFLASTILWKTAHQGGKLVHHHGIHSTFYEIKR